MSSPVAIFPAAVVSLADIGVARDRARTTLNGSIDDTQTTLTLASATGFASNMILTIQDEQIFCGTLVGTTYSGCIRGFAGTTAAAHVSGRTVSAFIDAFHHNRLAAEVVAIQQTLGENLALVQQGYRAAVYNFAAQSPGGTLSIGSNTITLSPVPEGLNASPVFGTHYLYISGGVGVAEAVPITGGTAVSGAASGTVIVTCANTHSGAWTIRSATAGIKEAVEAAVDGGQIDLGEGILTVYAKTTFGATHSFFGHGRTVTQIFNQSATQYALEYLTPSTGAPYVVTLSNHFSDFEVKSKYGIRLNDDDQTSITTMREQAYMVGGPIIERMLFTGVYGNGEVDASAGTNTAPTLTALKAFGVAISLNKTFNAHVRNCEFNYNGVAVQLRACDISKLENNRYYLNGRNVHMQGLAYAASGAYHADQLGSSNKISESDIIGVRRLGGIFLESTYFAYILNNFFEGSAFSGGAATLGQYLSTDNDIGTGFEGNRVDSFASTDPCVHFDSQYGVVISGTKYNPNAPNPPFTFGNTYFDGSNYPTKYHFTSDNNAQTPIPNHPQVLVGELKPYLFTHNNIPSLFFGALPTATYPWSISATTGRYAIKTTNPTFAFRIPVVSTAHRHFLVRLIGRRVTAAGFHTLSYVESGTTVVFTGSMNFTSTTEVEAQEYLVSIPSAEDGRGYFQFELANDQVEYESVEIVPVNPLTAGLGCGVITEIAIASNVITPIRPIHAIGTGLVKTITKPSWLQVGGILYFLPLDVTTYDATDNIVVPAAGGTLVINKLWSVCWNGTKFVPSY